MILAKMTKLTAGIISSVAMLCTVWEVASHRYVPREDLTNCNSSCSPLLCSHLNESDSSYASCVTKVDVCNCYKNEWNSPLRCPHFNSGPFLFFYEKNNRFLGFMCKPGVRKSFLKTSQYISRFLGIIVPWVTLELTQCCVHGIPNDVIKGHKNFPPSMERLFSTLNLDVFPLINRQTTKLNFYQNCLANITGKFSTSFPTLRAVDLASNLFTTIPQSTFSDLPYLERIDLKYNRIKHINRFTFENLTALTYLDLSFNEIVTISEDAFTSLENLQTLLIQKNKLETLPSNTFRKNQKLQKLSLFANKIKQIPGDLFHYLFKLGELDLSYNQIKTISEGLFFGLNELKYVFLHNNQISTMSSVQFTSNFDIRRINISENALTHLPGFTFTWALNNGPEILAGGNQITSLHIPLVPHIMQAKIVDLSQNSITLFKNASWTVSDRIVDPSSKLFKIDTIICKNCGLTSIPRELLINVTSTADFSENLITEINMDLLQNIAGLKTVNLVKNNISRIVVNWSYPILQDDTRKQAFNPSTEIILKNNRLNCDCHILPLLRLLDKDFQLPLNQTRSNMRFQLTDVICQEPANLRGLSVMYLVNDKELKTKLVCKVTSGCPESCRCHYVAVEEITVVVCVNQQLTNFPNLRGIDGELVVHLQRNQIRYLPGKHSTTWFKIRDLSLSDNKIDSLKNLTITSSLRSLDLQRNLMTDLPDVIRSLVLPNPNVSIILTDNPWKCSCEVLKVRALLLSADNLLDSNHISCYFPDSEDSVLVTNVTDQQLCPELFSDEQYYYRVLIPALAGLVVVVSICVTLLYRYQAEVQLWLFTRGYCLRFVAEEDIDGDKMYDAFVSYSSLDDEWVAKTLVSGLEEGSPSYKLCLHDRDWPVGEWIPDQIFRSVQFSRRTIIVLTDNFVESDWSRLEFHAAYRQALTDHVNRVLIVVPGDVPDVEKLDHELRAYIKLNTYIKWKDAHFWRKLRCAMPKTILSPKTKGAKELKLGPLDPQTVSPYSV